MLLIGFVKSAWSGVMDETKNPLRNAPPMTAHMVMQILAWMWSVIFAVMLSSYVAFGVTAIVHALLIAGIFVTGVIFRRAEKRAFAAG